MSAARLNKDKDKGGKRYWSTNLEKFARAFDAYVSDALEAKATKNTYLSHAGRQGDTVPIGDERKTINVQIGALLADIQTKTDDAGNVAFYTTLNAKAMFRGSACDDGTDGSPRQAMRDATVVLGFDVGVNLTEVAVPSRPDMPMRYNLKTRTIEYNTSVSRGRAADVEYMLEELLHAVDHASGENTVSASNPKFMEGGDFRTELEGSKSAALREQLAYPLQEVGYTETQIAAELFARVGVLYHGDRGLLQLAAPNTFAAYEQAFGNRFRDACVSGPARPAAGREGGRQVPAVVAPEVRSQGGQGAGTAGISASVNAERQSLRLRIVRGPVQRGTGGELIGARVDFGKKSPGLETCTPSAGTGARYLVERQATCY